MKMPENEDLPRIYKLDDVLIYVHRQRVERSGKKLNISPKPFALLCFLLAETWKHQNHRPYSISNEEIIANVWPDERGTLPATINRQTANVREAIGLDCIKGTRKGHELVGRIDDATRLQPEFIVANQIVVVSTTAVIFTLIATLFIRVILGVLGLTLTEPLFPLNGLGIAAVLGWFQGTIGALAWSIPISLWLLYKWFVIDKFLPWNGKVPFFATAVIGTSAGLFGGILVDLGLIFAQRKETLLGAGWILKLDDSRWTAFTVTGVAYAELALGGMIGCTCALTIMSIVRQLKWKAWLSSIPGKIENLEGMREAISGVFIEATRWGASIILTPMLATGSICYLFLQGQSPHILRYLGEAISLGLSGIVFVAGMLLGLLTLTKGFEITGETKCSLSPMAESSNQSQAAAKA